MEKRLALALVLCILWMIFASKVLTPPPAPQLDPRDDVVEEEPLEPPARGEPAATEDPLPVPEGDYEPTEGLFEESLQVDTDVFRAFFSTRGAVLQSLLLKNYFIASAVVGDDEAMADPANWLEILREVRESTPSFSLREMTDVRYALDEVCWEHTVEEGSSGKTLRFTYRTADGLVFTKRFVLNHGAYHLAVDLEIENHNPQRDEKLKLLFEGPCGITDRKRASFTVGPEGKLYTSTGGRGGAELETLAPGSLETRYDWSRRKGTSLIFSGVTNNYFALLLKPEEGKMISKVSFLALEDSEKMIPKVEAYETRYGAPPPPHILAEYREDALTNVRTDTQLSVKLPVPGETAQQTFLFFAGPKLSSLMKRPEYSEFYALITESYGSIGFLDWINPCIIWILAFFHSIVGNWGVAIICLTFVVKALLFPLNRIQQTSMYAYSEKMKKLKPKLEELKKKFKNNKKKYNEAQMALMKEEGVRPPLMGCLLMLLQLPIFIGLFQVLRTSFELRHSPFCLWIQDLSQPDALPLPFSLPLIGNSINLVPILMTVAFYYQQKVMPKPDTSDPQAAQMQKMMKFMPFLFLFILYGYASGLSLYWMTSNLISIFEYKFIRKKFPVGPKGDEGGKSSQKKASTKPKKS